MNPKRVIIIGSGPAGLFAAKTILDRRKNINVTVLEQGALPEERFCPAQKGKGCRECGLCSVLCGGGGAGLFSDGKLVEDLNSGGNADSISRMDSDGKKKRIEYIERTLVHYDGVSKRSKVPADEIQDYYKEKFIQQGLQAKYYPVLHMGTANLVHIIGGFLADLQSDPRCFLIFHERVTSISQDGSGFLLKTAGRIEYTADFVIAAVGKTGAGWLKERLAPMGCLFSQNNFYFGLRLEMPNEILAPLAELSFDPKIWKITKDGRKMKTHCMCRQGRIRLTKYCGTAVVAGHSVYTENNEIEDSQRSCRGNLNILMEYSGGYRKQKQELFERFRRESRDKLLVQTVGSFRAGCPDRQFPDGFTPLSGVPYQAANLRKVIGDESYSEALVDFIDALGAIFPGMNADGNLLYGPAFEWCMDAVKVSENMETSVPNLFAVGDGAGLSQGIVYSASTGIQAADEIIKRCIE